MDHPEPAREAERAERRRARRLAHRARPRRRRRRGEGGGADGFGGSGVLGRVRPLGGGRPFRDPGPHVAQGARHRRRRDDAGVGAAQADDRGGAGLLPGGRLRAGDGLRHDRHQRERQVRRAGDPVRLRAGHPPHAVHPRPEEDERAALHRRYDRRGRRRAGGAGEPGRPRRSGRGRGGGPGSEDCADPAARPAAHEDRARASVRGDGSAGSSQDESRPVVDAERGGYPGAERVHGHRQVTGPEGRPRMARRALRRDPGRCESMSVAESTIDPTRLARLIETEEAEFTERHKESRAMTERASRVLAGGVASSWQATDPHPIYLVDGHGSKVVDVDGNEYVDFHNGYGAMAVGHAHPRIAEIVSERVRRGTHFAQPTEDSVAVGEHLSERFGLPLWRFGNSGTESTMDAVRLMRAVTGKDILLKIEGSYHGHGDAVMVSVAPPADSIGDYEDPVSVPQTIGLPDAVVELTRVVPFNDL